ncbi:MAG: division/cell wall cluster transcriptional repressor MraZ [Candidatus Omnitrophica bacterium]|nr:division/cell wall cluster transcriptional repressor MraZ [Candidatus Omnitrophota bacterium]
MFYGEYLHSIDKKSRIIIPSRFRDALKENGIERLYVTRGIEECLFLFPENEWKVQENKFKTMSFTKRESRKFNRLFFGGAMPVEPDKQWRILVPDYLKEYAKLAKSIMIIGVSNRIEIWDKHKWEEFYNTSKENFEEISENLMDP